MSTRYSLRRLRAGAFNDISEDLSNKPRPLMELYVFTSCYTLDDVFRSLCVIVATLPTPSSNHIAVDCPTMSPTSSSYFASLSTALQDCRRTEITSYQCRLLCYIADALISPHITFDCSAIADILGSSYILQVYNRRRTEMTSHHRRLSCNVADVLRSMLSTFHRRRP